MSIVSRLNLSDKPSPRKPTLWDVSTFEVRDPAMRRFAFVRVFTLPKDWAASPESLDPSWTVNRYPLGGTMVLEACRLEPVDE